MPTHTGNHQKTKLTKPDSRLPSAVGRISSLAAAGLLLALCVFCARWGFADLVALDALSTQATLQATATRTGEAVEAKAADEVVSALLRAQHIDPGNPATAEQLGGAYTMDVQKGRDAGPKSAVSRQWSQAYEQYSRAVVLRPTSPYSWANRAWAKYYLGQIDRDLYLALQNAINLGPWEPEVQFVVVDLGFALWEEMPVDLRPQVLTLAQNGVRRYAAQIIAIAKKRGHLADVCKFEKLAPLPACKSVAG